LEWVKGVDQFLAVWFVSLPHQKKREKKESIIYTTIRIGYKFVLFLLFVSSDIIHSNI
jgi:hypothetical protein